jgi:hypothetical protein
MKIRELLEQTIGSVPPGQGKPLPPTEGPPNTSNTPNTTQPAGTPVSTLGNQQSTAAPANPNAPAGTPAAGTAQTTNPAQTQQMQQASKDTMTDLDKIAAQIIGLKQKQQQMQQQMQQPPKV